MDFVLYHGLLYDGDLLGKFFFCVLRVENVFKLHLLISTIVYEFIVIQSWEYFNEIPQKFIPLIICLLNNHILFLTVIRLVSQFLLVFKIWQLPSRFIFLSIVRNLLSIIIFSFLVMYWKALTILTFCSISYSCFFSDPLLLQKIA